MHARANRTWIRAIRVVLACALHGHAVICNPGGDDEMARGSKDTYTDKQKRQAAHIERSEREAGRSKADAERIA